jgi:hypothetical protein
LHVVSGLLALHPDLPAAASFFEPQKPVSRLDKLRLECAAGIELHTFFCAVVPPAPDVTRWTRLKEEDHQERGTPDPAPPSTTREKLCSSRNKETTLAKSRIRSIVPSAASYWLD